MPGPRFGASASAAVVSVGTHWEARLLFSVPLLTTGYTGSLPAAVQFRVDGAILIQPLNATCHL